MTRFARAKGSKASNERTVEEATSWSEIQQQLEARNREKEEAKKRADANIQKENNYKTFLDSVEQERVKEVKWADFPESAKTKKTVKKAKTGKADTKSYDEAVECSSEQQSPDVAVKKKKAKTGKADTKPHDEGVECSSEQQSPDVTVKKKKTKTGKADTKSHDEGVECSSEQQSPDVAVKKKKAKKRPLEIVDKESEENDLGGNKKIKIDKKKNSKKLKTKPVEIVATGTDQASEETGVKEHIKIDKKKDPKDLTEIELKRIEAKNKKKVRQAETRKKMKEIKLMENNETPSESDQTTVNNNEIDNFVVPSTPTFKNPQETKPKKQKKEKPARRKEPQENLRINGNEVKIVYYEGFPMKSEDVARLKELRRQMIGKGIPQSEIRKALKLERRRAEKAFSREKKKVCYNCRKFGHNLSECPEVGEELIQSTGTGICYKCGSAEHSHFQCKVVKGQEYKFAKCFICHEQGHISKQCPDNARGLYPDGGGCKVCGDVTHLKRDCPQFQAKQQHEENKISLELIDYGNPDNLDGESAGVGVVKQIKKVNKIIKF